MIYCLSSRTITSLTAAAVIPEQAGMVFLYNAWGDIFKVKVSAGAKVGAKVRAFAAAKVGVNADIGSANQEWVYGPDGWCSKSYGSQRISAELDVVGNGGNLSYGRTYPSGGNDWSKTSFDKNLNIKDPISALTPTFAAANALTFAPTFAPALTLTLKISPLALYKNTIPIDGTFGLEVTILIGVGFEIDFSEISNFLQDRFGW
jgi:hypothetical protein